MSDPSDPSLPAHAALHAFLAGAGASDYDARDISARFAEGEPAPLLRFMLLHLLWREVIDDAQPESGERPAWIERWRHLAETGFPFVDAAALGRLMEAGANPDDLTDVVRSAQVLLLYNVTNLLDNGWGALRAVLPEPLRADLSWELMATRLAEGTHAGPLGSLHEGFEELDPAGRDGAPRS